MIKDFFAILSNAISNFQKIPSKNAVYSFDKITIIFRSNEALRKCLPGVLRDINQKFIVDENVKKWHFSLLKNLGMLNDPNCQDHMN